MRFNLIKEPEENPTDLLDSYRRQNILMQKIRILHTAFDGIKLNNWSDSNRELPNILIGSVCEFEGRLFEAKDNIILEDNNKNNIEKDMRYIKLVIHRDSENSEDDYLTAEVSVGSSKTAGEEFPNYDYENRGFYVKENGKIKEKYLRLSMKYSATLGGYVEKKYWNISDLMRAGIQFKKHSVNLGVGTHEFEVPDSVNTLTVHLVSGGGGGMTSLSSAFSGAGGTGGKSEVSINGKAITTCSGGTGGYQVSGKLQFMPGIGGKATGQGRLINGISANSPSGAIFSTNITLASGGNGGSAPDRYGYGGGSGSAAIVEITRAMLGGSKKITIIVGKGGAGGSNGVSVNGQAGEDGSAVVEYFSRG